MDRPATNLRTVFGEDFEGMETPVLPVSITGGARSLDPEIFGDELLRDEERSPFVKGTSVPDVHRCPRKVEGFGEPLFPACGPKRAILEHPPEAPGLSKTSDLRAGAETPCPDEGVPP